VGAQLERRGSPVAQREPGYLALLRAGELWRRVERALQALADCRLCPRECGCDRLHDHIAFCRTGRLAPVSSAFPHHGEEDCLRGERGSGTVFFTHCNLRCVFCQNFDISQATRLRDARTVGPRELADTMLELQEAGCHNINWVTPEHVVPQCLEALALAAEDGLRLPIVYNTSAYDSAQSLELLDGVVDIYMPDFKVWSRELAARWLKAADYPEVARSRIAEMHRQVGNLTTDEHGLAVRGLFVRHLVMPGALEDSTAILRWIREALGAGAVVNLMDQYRPAGRVGGGCYPELDRRPSLHDYAEAWALAHQLGLTLMNPLPLQVM
jgi:putative pyruvate formate lyase activating enzyme